MDHKDLIIISLILALIFCIFKIFWLRRCMRKEMHKRLIPLLNLEINREELALYLKNESFCMAKNIRIDNVKVSLKYDYAKTLLVQFQDIDSLNPAQKEKLKYRVFDGPRELHGVIADNLVAHLLNASFQTRITCYNIENMRFQIIIEKENGHFNVKQARPYSSTSLGRS